MAEFDSLPNEILLHILKFLSFKDALRLAQTSKRLLPVCRTDILWQHYCQRDFRFYSIRNWNCSSFREVYSKVLHRYGKLQGLWKLRAKPYSMLVHIKEENGQIVGLLIQPPLSGNVVDSVRQKPLFSIKLRGEEAVVLCSKGCTAQINMMESEEMEYQCEACMNACTDPQVSEQLLAEWLKEELTMAAEDIERQMLHHHRNPMFIHKIRNLAEQTHYWSSFHLTKVPEPHGYLVSPVTVGVFKGTYGSHGLEFIQLTMSDDGYTLLGNKLTGDPNVPAGETSLLVDLRQPMHLTVDEQKSLGSLNAVTTPILPQPFIFAPNDMQPFSLCPDLLEREAPANLPDTCEARFAARGRIAGQGYTNPSFSRGHIVVFRKDLFGFFWLDLHVFSLFSLMTECNSN